MRIIIAIDLINVNKDNIKLVYIVKNSFQLK